MIWTIDKSFDFCYGHRVWSQDLNTNFTGTDGACLACRHLHGHQGKLKIFLEADILTSGMVTDFKHLGWMKDFINKALDHKFIMDVNDPLVTHECPEYVDDSKILDLSKFQFHDEGYWTPNLNNLLAGINPAIIEKYEGMVLVDFVPTSENIAAWLLIIAQTKMAKLGIKVVSCEFWETPKSHCEVRA